MKINLSITEREMSVYVDAQGSQSDISMSELLRKLHSLIGDLSTFSTVNLSITKQTVCKGAVGHYSSIPSGLNGPAGAYFTSHGSDIGGTDKPYTVNTTGDRGRGGVFADTRQMSLF